MRTRSYHYTVYTRPVCTCTWIESRRLALARRREFGGGRRRPQTLRRCRRCRLTPSPPPPSPPLTPPPPSPPAPLLRLPLQRCHRHQPSTSLPPIAAAHAASVAAASIDRLHRPPPSPPLASPSSPPPALHRLPRSATLSVSASPPIAVAHRCCPSLPPTPRRGSPAASAAYIATTIATMCFATTA